MFVLLSHEIVFSIVSRKDQDRKLSNGNVFLDDGNVIYDQGVGRSGGLEGLRDFLDLFGGHKNLYSVYSEIYYTVCKIC